MTIIIVASLTHLTPRFPTLYFRKVSSKWQSLAARMGGTKPKDNIKKAEKISFSLDVSHHIESMKQEIDFLQTVSNYPLLFTPGPVLNNAIRRLDMCL